MNAALNSTLAAYCVIAQHTTNSVVAYNFHSDARKFGVWITIS